MRLLHLGGGPQGYARLLLARQQPIDSSRALDLVQDLYIKELKAYKPAAQVRKLYADKVRT